jgi:hypothetical protein
MRQGRAVFFERAVLVLLSLPAGCGGKAESGTSPSPDAAFPVLGPDAADCGWQAPPAPAADTCTWITSFSGDPVACAGFPVGAGTPSQCLAICGRNANGQAPDSCEISAYAASVPYALDCNATTGACMPSNVPGNGGRRPGYFASLGFGPAPAGREVGVHFARVACMEAGSVDAFRLLRDELRAHGAPGRLVRGASRAVRDEMRHVRQTAALARRFGEKPIAPLSPPTRICRPFEEIALENAVEGCVRETYSALECLWQSRRATDPVVRSTMARIARDEMRHLALSWAVHDWATSRLGPAARRNLRDAQRSEVAELVREMATDPVDLLVTLAGLPRARESHALVSSIERELRAA